VIEKLPKKGKEVKKVSSNNLTENYEKEVDSSKSEAIKEKEKKLDVELEREIHSITTMGENIVNSVANDKNNERDLITTNKNDIPLKKD